tara:strand:- start:66323 stop:66688 length:366 start_codon:yes stop_codon:yes gene_type:complete
MILFDWHKVRLIADYKNGNIIKIMHAITWPVFLPTRYQRRLNPFYDYDFSGHSFLLSPEKLLERRDVPLAKRVEYISLAARRCYADYLITEDATLDYRLVKGPIENELITVKTNRVVFDYE